MSISVPRKLALKYHKVITKPASEKETTMTKRTFNMNLSIALAESGSIFISNLDRREAWRMEQRFSKLLGEKVKAFHMLYEDDGKTLEARRDCYFV